MKEYKVPKNNAMCARVAIEFSNILILVYPMVHIYIFLHGEKSPFKRGFFCDDQSLKHPDLPEEISESIAFAIWAIIVFLLIPAIELLHVTIFSHLSPTPLGKWGPWVFIELYRILGYFTLGALFTLLTTEMAKFKVGRLRPYFLTVCDPNLTDAMCRDEYGYNIFVTPDNYTCNGKEEEVNEARKSFLSGHTSLSFYTATFLIVYIQARLCNLGSDNHRQSVNKSVRMFEIMFSGLKILRPFLQFGIFSLAAYITLTRISDYKHHPGDVLAGMVVGIFFAFMILIFLMDLFHRPRSFKTEEQVNERMQGVDNDVEQSTVDGIRMRCQNRKTSTSSETNQPLSMSTMGPKSMAAPPDKTS